MGVKAWKDVKTWEQLPKKEMVSLEPEVETRHMQIWCVSHHSSGKEHVELFKKRKTGY